MSLQIVWRNAFPPTQPRARIERLLNDDFGALYAVTYQDQKMSFELIRGRASNCVSASTAVPTEAARGGETYGNSEIESCSLHPVRSAGVEAFSAKGQ